MEDLEALGDSLTVSRSAPTLRLQALEKLRRAIIEGKLPPGSRLVERKLCELLDVSRTVVREILRQLETEGWVVNPPYKGPTVATIGPDEARQIYEIRAALEGLAAKLCAIRATDEQIARLELAVERMAKLKGKDVERLIQLVEAFYDTLLEAANNDMMKAYLASQRSRLARLRSLSLSRPQRASVSVAEKQRLVAAIRARDPERAQQLSQAHIAAAAEVALPFLQSQAATATEPPERKLNTSSKKSLPPSHGKKRKPGPPVVKPVRANALR